MRKPFGFNAVELVRPSPADTLDAVTASDIVRARKPTVSKAALNGVTPSDGMLPVLGLNAGTPQYAAGRQTDPTVCVPSANGTWPAATAAAEPLLDPPGVCLGFAGLVVSAGSK